MKEKEFVEAVERKLMNIIIDEVRIRRGQVREVLAHTGRLVIKYDAEGKAYCSQVKDQEINQDTSYYRDVEFDVCF